MHRWMVHTKYVHVMNETMFSISQSGVLVSEIKLLIYFAFDAAAMATWTRSVHAFGEKKSQIHSAVLFFSSHIQFNYCSAITQTETPRINKGHETLEIKWIIISFSMHLLQLIIENHLLHDRKTDWNAHFTRARFETNLIESDGFAVRESILNLHAVTSFTSITFWLLIMKYTPYGLFCAVF